VERAMLDDGSVVSTLQASLVDKNLASVELKNGQIKVNGQPMSVTENLNIATYYIPSANVNLNTAYDFEVVLPNGSSHKGKVTSQPKAFTSVTVPSNISLDNDLTISWQDVYVHDELIISLSFSTQSVTVPGATFALTPAQMQAGTFTIPKSTFSSATGVKSMTITLTGTRYGTIDSKFRNGSMTVSRMSVAKKVTFN
jgi:hypothetical protein